MLTVARRIAGALAGPFAAAALIASPAVAEDPRAEAQAAAVAVRASLDEAARHVDLRFAFAVRMTDRTAPDAPAIRLRFDPRRPTGARWRLEHAGESPTRAEQKALKLFQKHDEGDKELLLGMLVDVADRIEIVGFTDDEATFEFPIDRKALPRGAEGALVARGTFDRRAGHVARIDVVSKRPFRTMTIARVDRYEQVRVYRAAGRGKPVVLASAYSIASGRALVKEFRQDYAFVYEDLEVVDAPLRVAAAQ